MSEEEIIEYLEEIIDFLKDDDYMLRAGIDNEFVEGLLDLYNQEKEKNKELVEEFPKILEETTKNAISKDKIKAKIKELEEQNKSLFFASDCVLIEDNEMKIKVLEDLLKEN